MKKLVFSSSLILLLLFISACTKKEDNNVTIDEPYDKAVTAIITENNKLWVGTLENGLYMYDGNSWTAFKYPETLLSNYISALEISNDGVIYAGTDMGISRFENGAWATITTDDGLFNNDIHCLDYDDDNILWIGTRNNSTVIIKNFYNINLSLTAFNQSITT